MALPDNQVSATPVPSLMAGARGLGVTPMVDYEDGGIAIQDPSQGLLVQRWRARLIGEQVIVDAPSVPEFVLFEGAGITEISMTFDQNMRPCLAYVQGGRAKLWWFDSVPGEQVITELAEDVITPRVALDDKRPTQSANSDIILAYVRGGALYYRQQRERFQTERLLDAGPHAGVIKIGLDKGLRLQFFMRYPT